MVPSSIRNVSVSQAIKAQAGNMQSGFQGSQKVVVEALMQSLTNAEENERMLLKEIQGLSKEITELKSLIKNQRR